MIVNARMAVLKANDSTDCSKIRRRIARLVTATSARAPGDPDQITTRAPR